MALVIKSGVLHKFSHLFDLILSTVKSKNVKFYTLAKSYIQFPAKVYFKKGGIIALKLKNFKVSGNLRRRFFLIHFHSIGIDMLD